MRFFGKKTSKPSSEPSTSSMSSGGTFLTGDPVKDEKNVGHLLQAIAEVSSHIDIDTLLRSIVDKSIQITKAERGLLILRDSSGHDRIRIARSQGGKDLEGPIEYSQSISTRVLEELKPICTTAFSDDQAAGIAPSVYNLKIRTLMCVPLQANNRLLGAIYVDSTTANGEFTESDLRFFEALSNQLAIALENARGLESTLARERMEEELSIGREIQMSMIPLDFPVFEERSEIAIHATLLPAREVGGDFYDFFFVDDDRLCFCIGDVSGKGVPSALFMAMTKTLIKSRASADSSTASILGHVNDELSKDNKKSMFVTVFVGILNVRTGELTFTNAGHNPPYVIGPHGAHRLDDRHGPVIGAREGLTYGESSRVLSAGEQVMLYTDGVTEAFNPKGELFGEQRLVELLGVDLDRPPQALVPAIVDTVQAFEAEADQSDDITILAVQFQGTAR